MQTGNQNISSTPVAIIGAGPTGLSLALGLARNNTRSLLIEKKTRTSKHSKAPVIHLRTREIFEQWGVGVEFLRAGNLVRQLEVQDAAGTGNLFSLDLRELEQEADDPGILILEQAETEKILLKAVRSSGMCQVQFGWEAVGLQSAADAVTLRVRTGEGQREIRVAYAVGCDGASSFVREALELPFEGFTYSVKTVLADISLQDQRDAQAWPRLFNDRKGITLAVQLFQGTWRIIRLEPGDPENAGDLDDPAMSEIVEDVLGKGPFKRVWSSPFKIHRRSSPRFKTGRTLLAGDAAHIHSPVGGQGMNAGIQDAHNLAWKLAFSLSKGHAGTLLDSFETERRSVVVRKVSRYTNFFTRAFLQAPLFIRKFSFFSLRWILSVGFLRRRFLRRVTMIDLGYSDSASRGKNGQAAGRRLPNPALQAPDGTRKRLYQFLPGGPTIITLHRDRVAIENIREIMIGNEGYTDPSGLLKGLLQKGKGWILVRPDLHIAWSGNDPKSLVAAVQRNFDGIPGLNQR